MFGKGEGLNWVFISHPYSDNPELRKKQVDKICKELEGEVIPISPLHLFSYIQDETSGQRTEIMEICKILIDICHKHNDNGPDVYVYDYGKLVGGQLDEFVHCFNNKYETEFREVE